MKTAKLLFICGREPSYVRNAMLWRCFQRHFDSRLIGDERSGSLSFRLARLALRSVTALRQPHNLVVIGFYGHPLLLLVKRLSRQPILFDPFVSTFDTLISDRAYSTPNSLFARFCWALDRRSFQQADHILADTQTHAAFYRQAFDLPTDQVETLYVGCDASLFHPHQSPSNPAMFTVFTYSTYMPLHGMETIVEAANLCRSLPIRFRLVGNQGPTWQQVSEVATRLGVNNVDFIPSLPFAQLSSEIAKSAICLGGPFGNTEKAKRVVTGKTYQFIAMAKPVMVGDSPANHELFQHAENAFFVPLGDPQALAQAITTLYHDGDLCHRLGQNAYTLFGSRLSWDVLEKELVGIVVQRFL